MTLCACHVSEVPNWKFRGVDDSVIRPCMSEFKGSAFNISYGTRDVHLCALSAMVTCLIFSRVLWEVAYGS
jgi:hypothetical protein